MYAYMHTFPYLAYRPTLLPNFLIFEHFLDFWSWFEGVNHALKMFKYTFLLKMYPKASKICLDDLRVLSPLPTTVQWYLYNSNRCKNVVIQVVIISFLSKDNQTILICSALSSFIWKFWNISTLWSRTFRSVFNNSFKSCLSGMLKIFVKFYDVWPRILV